MDSLKFDEIKTKKMVSVLDALKVNKALVVLDGENNDNVEFLQETSPESELLYTIQSTYMTF